MVTVRGILILELSFLSSPPLSEIQLLVPPGDIQVTCKPLGLTDAKSLSSVSFPFFRIYFLVRVVEVIVSPSFLLRSARNTWRLLGSL